jgi:hypothetical protein
MHEVASQDAGCLGFQGRVTSSARAILTLPRSASASSQRITGDPDAVTRSQYSKAALARDDGLRRVRTHHRNAAAPVGQWLVLILRIVIHGDLFRHVLLVGDLVVLGRRRRHQRRLVNRRP